MLVISGKKKEPSNLFFLEWLWEKEKGEGEKEREKEWHGNAD